MKFVRELIYWDDILLNEIILNQFQKSKYKNWMKIEIENRVLILFILSNIIVCNLIIINEP